MAVTSKKGQEALKGKDKLSTLPGFKTETPTVPPVQYTQHTQGTQDAQDRKQKHPRINMAFYGDNLDYVREAAYQSRMSVTEYVNQLIVDDRNRKLAGFSGNADRQMNIDDVNEE